MRSLLICHADSLLDRRVLPRWMASFSELVGVVVIAENKKAVKRRAWRQLRRVGWLRFLDVIAFRIHYRLTTWRADKEWEESELARLEQLYQPVESSVIDAMTPNQESVRAFIEKMKPDVVIARTKFLMTKRIYQIPRRGTYVLHPGICPQYRNSHGCFWALCNRDLNNVGLTLLRIDDGIDTGPIFGYFRYSFDEATESHHRIQQRCLFENLDAIAAKLIDVAADRASSIDTYGLPSSEWGQPWLSEYLKWKNKLCSQQRA